MLTLLASIIIAALPQQSPDSISFSGTVVDADNKPLPDVEVALWRGDSRTDRPRRWHGRRPTSKEHFALISPASRYQDWHHIAFSSPTHQAGQSPFK